jgi:hypothetical protein
MKFWQLLQFIDREAVLADAKFGCKWPWLVQWLRDLSRIVHDQEREKLDANLPEELVVAALGKSNIRFEFTQGYLRCSVRTSANESFPAVEAHLRFGAHAISEAHEHGLYEIRCHKP